MPGQPHRLIFIYKKLLQGEVLTSNQIQDMISEEIEIVSIRTIQRDLRLLQKIDPSIIGKVKGKEIYWMIPSETRYPKQIFRFETNELLALHFLKAHLKTFKGTKIEKDAEKLFKKIEKLAPEDVVLDETIYWDQNVGYYDYSQHNELIENVIQATAKKNWYQISYTAAKTGTTKDIIVRFETIFSYLGLLYVVAYVPKHKAHVSLAIHNISEIKELKDYVNVAPPFSFREWANYRFGVFSGELHDVKLLIKNEFKHFFLNRTWHVSQVEKLDKDGNLILEMRVPIGVDLINWISSWSDAIIVLEPQELIKKIINRLTQALSNYHIAQQSILKAVDPQKSVLFSNEDRMYEALKKSVESEPAKYKLSLKNRRKKDT
ncbi:MAG: WYL domain-containing protein [Ignavibacteria bacterium]|nr:WYL domain-containing protein [Ignavibacteria bacterium]